MHGERKVVNPKSDVVEGGAVHSLWCIVRKHRLRGEAAWKVKVMTNRLLVDVNRLHEINLHLRARRHTLAVAAS